MEIYKDIISPVLDHLDSETMHVAARKALSIASSSDAGMVLLDKLNYGGSRFFDQRLAVDINGVYFDNPVMVGAGWDKVGEAVKGLYSLGFSGVEVGSVLDHPQDGNPKPRQFMVAPGVALNRLGFNSPGATTVRDTLIANEHSGIPVGISIGKNKDVPDWEAPVFHSSVMEALYDEASYFAINVSSPNTPGLRGLQDKEPLNDNVKLFMHNMEVYKGRQKPTFVKIAPELTKSAIDDVIEVALENNLTGIIATNTTTNESIKGSHGVRGEAGGISGDDSSFRKMSTEAVAHIYREAGDKLKIIGVGGVKDGDTAWEKITAGASLVQIVTAIRGEGPAVAGRINRRLIELVDINGFKNISEAVGIFSLSYK